ncbi:Leucine Rich Repeat [Seminavis robusta]|uniref:Leucine Rich Repeat n=1 Tax=Seminavis robusta TaxID=568900 RepID=A0A9N8DYX1_9STRA|nr:Leucine Rich Repeat [Seminavis robusta]|eukprot:Sro378_g130240.1 Leucine Rich Repeat (730) ;mRNA; f:20493-22682
MSSTSRHPQPKSQEEAALERDLSLGQLVLERSQTATIATKTAEDIKQEELLRRAAEKRNNNDNIGDVPAPAVVRRPYANTRKKAPDTATTTAVSTNTTEDDDQRQKDELALLSIVAKRSSAASREEADLAKKQILLNPGNPGDYDYDVSEKVDANPIEDNPMEYDNETGRPSSKHSLPPGSLTPGAYSGAVGANYEAVKPVRLDLLGTSSHHPGEEEEARARAEQQKQGVITNEEAQQQPTESIIPLEEKQKPSRNRKLIAAAAMGCLLLVVIIILAIVIPLSVGGGKEESPPSLENTQELSIDKALLPNAPNSTWDSIQDNLDSPQYKAYNWLTLDPSLHLYETWQKEQRFALATFYYAFNGPKWRFKDPLTQNEWLSYETNECEWGVYLPKTTDNHHVICNDDDIVRLISVTEQGGLKGSVPLELSLLGSLQGLDLSDNVLQTNLTNLLPIIHMPEWFQSLEAIHCTNCRLEGSLPPELWDWTNLRVLWLQENSLTGTISTAIQQLSRLRALELFDNKLSGPIPSEVGLVTSLKNLGLRLNSFTSAPSELGLLTNLVDLGLGDNEMSHPGFSSELAKLTNLRHLNLVNLNRKGTNDNSEHALTIPTEVGLMAALEVLDAERNGWMGAIPSEIGNLSRLTDLHLRRNRLSNTMPTELGRMSALETLYLTNNQFTGSIPSELGQITSLHALLFVDNSFQKHFPLELCQRDFSELLTDWCESRDECCIGN